MPRTGQLRFLWVSVLTRSAYAPSVVTIRRATVQDAPTLDRLNVRLLQAAYGGQMPDEQLDGPRPEEQAAAWERGLHRDRDQDPVLVAEQVGRVVGFAVVGPAQDPEGAGELYAITVDPDHDDRAAAQAWLQRMGVAGGPVHILLGKREELEPVWDGFGIVPIARSPRAEDPGASPEKGAPALRPPPSAAHDPYPAVGDGSYRGHPRHARGVDFEHSAYALLIDKEGRQRVGFPYEQITSDLLLADLLALKAES